MGIHRRAHAKHPAGLAASRAGAGATRGGTGTREPRGPAGQQQDWPLSQPTPPPANPSRANPSPHGHSSTWPLQPHLGEDKLSWGSSAVGTGGDRNQTLTENPLGGGREGKNIHKGKMPTLRGVRAAACVGLVPLKPPGAATPSSVYLSRDSLHGENPSTKFL